jgi:hypothetical protein
MVTAWASSPVYGPVVLGPVQRDVLELVRRLTDHGRRPELTLARLAQLVGRPMSSVQDALERLRALGLVGYVTRMGRHGSHRLFRPRAITRALDPARHRRAVARILHRFVADPLPRRRADLYHAGINLEESAGQALRRHGLGSWIDQR